MAQHLDEDGVTKAAVGAVDGAAVTVTETTAEIEGSSKKGNFLVLPIVITEPAIGEGLGAAIVYFHGKNTSAKPRVMNGNSVVTTARKSTPPPTVTGVMGFYTNNDTNGVGIVHVNSFKADKYRFTGILADMTVISNIFFLDIPFNFEIDGNLAFTSLKRRWGDSNLFLGLSLMAFDADVDFKLDTADIPPVPLLGFGLTNVGIAGSVTYDRRDASTMPKNGQLFDLNIWRYDDALGSDFEYNSVRLKLLSFHTLHEKFTFGLRFDASTVSGSPPFFAVPFVSLRGIPALRFQADTAGAVEVEGRYEFADRWAGLVFAGAGFTDVKRSELETSQDMNAWGAGFRFKALESQNVWIGLDVAEGPEETVWYFQVGQGW
jgi:hypothetical protein